MKIKSGIQKNWWNVVEVFPVFLPLFLAVGGLWLVILLLLGKFTDGWIAVELILLLPVILASWKLLPLNRPGSIKEKRVIDLAVIGFVLFWCFFNVHYNARHVLADRDPGIYSLGAIWLEDHPTTNITAAKPFGSMQGLIPHSVGIWGDVKVPQNGTNAYLQPQGMHLVPALAAVAGKIGGINLLFASSVLLGGVAILALYGFSRQLVKPRWAGLASLIFGACLPLIYFSKDMYTEPLAAAFIMGSLTLLWLAYERRAQAKWWLWFLAGLLTGANVLTRADGYFATITFSAFLVIALILEKNKKVQKNLARGLVFFLIGSAITMWAGYLDITNLTSSYYITNKKVIKIQLLLLALVLAGGTVAWLITKKTDLLTKLDNSTRKWRTNAALIVFFAATLLLMSRPLWLVAKEAVINGTTYLTQLRTGLPIEPRTYAENTVEWASWYVGAFLVALAILGSAILIKKVFDNRKVEYLGLLFLFLLTSLTFFVNPKITPDHIWASRRLLPVIIPCLIVIAAYAASLIYEKATELKASYRLIGALAVAFYLVLQPLIISRPFIKADENRPVYGAFVNFCSKLPGDAAVLWVANSSLALNGVQTTRAICKLPSAGYTMSPEKPGMSLDKSKLKTLAKAAQSNGFQPYIAVQGSAKSWMSLDTSIQQNLNPVSVYEFRRVEQTLTGPPRVALEYSDSIELGKINSDGTVSPVK